MSFQWLACWQVQCSIMESHSGFIGGGGSTWWEVWVWGALSACSCQRRSWAWPYLPSEFYSGVDCSLQCSFVSFQLFIAKRFPVSCNTALSFFIAEPLDFLNSAAVMCGLSLQIFNPSFFCVSGTQAFKKICPGVHWYGGWSSIHCEHEAWRYWQLVSANCGCCPTTTFECPGNRGWKI